MAKYVFQNGQITVENSVYSPLERDDKDHQRGVVLIPIQPRQTGNETDNVGSKEDDT